MKTARLIRSLLQLSSVLAPLNHIDLGQHLVERGFVGLCGSVAEFLLGSIRQVRANEAPCHEAGSDAELGLEGQVAV